MVIFMRKAPALVIHKLIIEDIHNNTPAENECSVLLVPFASNRILIGPMRIALYYFTQDIDSLGFVTLIKGTTTVLGSLPETTQVEYTIFTYSNEFGEAHWKELQSGQTAYALIRSLINSK